MDVQQAQAYHQRHKPQALLVRRAGDIEAEFYDAQFDVDSPHALYSGTKSFWGTCAIEGQREGLLELDETVWQGATVRQLLSLTAGVPFGGLGAAVPLYDRAIASIPNAAPGERFTYGGIPLQIFGSVLAARLEQRGRTPHEYLEETILRPADVHVSKWRELKDGTHPLPTGAFVTAREWSKYGAHVLRNLERYAECFRGSGANPRYGLAWWLAPKTAPPGTFYASGSGGQAMYCIPSQALVIVRFGAGGSFNHEAFLKACRL